ncbi:MAG: DUF2147 domain-containing protein [Chitinophagaceae bacterium]
MKKIFIGLLLLLLANFAFAQKDPIEKVWYNASKTAKIQVYKAVNGKFYGKIIWLQKPNDANDKPRTDIENPNKNLRNIPLLHLIILKDFRSPKNDSNIYEDGTVYDPNTGKTYCGKLILAAKTLSLKGYICGLSWFSRTSVWTIAE